MRVCSLVVWRVLGSFALLCLMASSQGAGYLAESSRQVVPTISDKATTLAERRAALIQLQDAARLFVQSNEPLNAAATFNRIGRLQLIMREPQLAIDAHNQALELAKDSPSDNAVVDALNGLASAWMVLGKVDQAETILQRSLSIVEQTGYTAGRAEALLTLSDRENYFNHIKAAETGSQALALWQSVNDKDGQARTHLQLGDCFLSQNLIVEAYQNYNAALQLSRELNDPLGQASAMILLGFVEFRKGDWDQEISFLVQAQSLIPDESAEPMKLAQIDGGLADAFNENGLSEQGLLHYQQMVVHSQATKSPLFVGYALLGVGTSQYLLGHYDDAIAQVKLALADAEPTGILAAQCHELLGKIYLATSDYQNAQQHLNLALSVYIKSINPKEAAQARALIGQILERQGNLDEAEHQYKQALQTFTDLTDVLNQAVTNYALGRLELQRGNLDSAENYLSQSISITESLRRASSSRDLTAAFSATVHDRYQTYIDCLMRKEGQRPEGLVRKAFETSELARGRSLTELLRATQANLLPGLAPELAGEEKSLRQLLRAKEDARVTLLAKQYKKEDLDRTNQELAELESKYEAVVKTIRAQHPTFEQITHPAALSLGEIQSQVIADDQTTLLEYSLGSEKSYLWVVTRNQLRSYDLPPKEKINSLAETIYKSLSKADNKEADQKLSVDLQTLSQMVIPPAVDLNTTRIIIVADEALHYIPFQILSAPHDEQPLVVNHEVINAPSASILGQLRLERTQRPVPERTLVAFGDPVFPSNYAQNRPTGQNDQIASALPLDSSRWQSGLRDIELSGDTIDPNTIQPLFFTKGELKNLREVAGANSFIATGFDASREQLAKADLSKSAILHIATHGILDPKRPDRSGLLLSMVTADGKPQDGFFDLQDIYGLHAPVDLVVLSACRTGLGKEVRGEGLIGLTRGFMYAGASSVVASLWKVDDEATSELMKRFYTNMLQQGMTPSAALRAAQNSIRQEPQWRSPYFWAAFTLQGEYREVITKPHSAAASYLKIAAVGTILVLLIGVAWFYSRRRNANKITPP